MNKLDQQLTSQFTKIKQFDSKNLYLYSLDDVSYLVSYKTIVGELTKDGWIFTEQRYSTTTSRHINWFKESN